MRKVCQLHRSRGREPGDEHQGHAGLQSLDGAQRRAFLDFRPDLARLARHCRQQCRPAANCSRIVDQQRIWKLQRRVPHAHGQGLAWRDQPLQLHLGPGHGNRNCEPEWQFVDGDRSVEPARRLWTSVVRCPVCIQHDHPVSIAVFQGSERRAGARVGRMDHRPAVHGSKRSSAPGQRIYRL